MSFIHPLEKYCQNVDQLPSNPLKLFQVVPLSSFPSFCHWPIFAREECPMMIAADGNGGEEAICRNLPPPAAAVPLPLPPGGAQNGDCWARPIIIGFNGGMDGGEGEGESVFLGRKQRQWKAGNGNNNKKRRSNAELRERKGKRKEGKGRAILVLWWSNGGENEMIGREAEELTKA
jgi:hypothetical protein